jgi:AraC family transcriptional activator of pobA
LKRKKSATANGIPTVAFYGDAAEWATSALLHSELLTERSRLHAWKIRPHRHSSLTQLFWLRRGSGTGRFDAERYELTAPCVVVVPELCVHEFEWGPESDGSALSIAASLVHELWQQIGLQASILKEPVVLPAEEDHVYVNVLFGRIHEEYVNERPMKEMALDSLVKALTIWIARHSAPARRAAEQHHRAAWTVADFADELGMTPPHLNAICQQQGGVSALRLIHDRVLLAARRELTYTDKSIADVAAHLGFSEPSYFTRFFKRKMSMTPKEFRRQSGFLEGETPS